MIITVKLVVFPNIILLGSILRDFTAFSNKWVNSSATYFAIIRDDFVFTF